MYGSTYSPGIYQTGSAFALTGTMTLDARGDPNAVSVFQIEAAMNTAAASWVVLANGAQAGNVYWQAVGANTLASNTVNVPPVPANAGYFRVGYDNMLDVPNRPSNSSFAGDLAFAAVYLTALTDAQIKTVYIAGT